MYALNSPKDATFANRKDYYWLHGGFITSYDPLTLSSQHFWKTTLKWEAPPGLAIYP